MRLATWNVNGIRAAERNGFLDWFRNADADVVCLQEVKAFPGQLSPALRSPQGYFSEFHPARKPGYSGVAVFSRVEPLKIENSIGIPEIDQEGRVQVIHFKDFVLINAYFPNSQRDHARLGYKLAFCDAMLAYCDKLRTAGKHVIVCGDFNIAHRPIDLKNPKSNEDNAGFLPEERAWLDRFEGAGYIDAFRQFTPDPGHYTWWSYRPGVREKNIGWRLDYHWTNAELKDRLASAVIQNTVPGSDHCPVLLELRN